jgi:hypothetical protein
LVPMMSAESADAKLLTSPSTMPPAYLSKCYQIAMKEGSDVLLTPLQRVHRGEQHALIASGDKSCARRPAGPQARQQMMRRRLHSQNVELLCDGLRREGGAVAEVGAGNETRSGEGGAQ